MKTKRSGLTVIEIMVVVGIIAILIGLLLPAVHTVQKMAKETKQKAQFTTIELGLAAFKSDYGDYPPSNGWNPMPNAPAWNPRNYCGAQKLAEAMLGWDLMGFHPDSAWRADGLDAAGGPTTYDPLTIPPTQANLQKRKGRYVELDTANAFMLGGGVDALYPGAVDPLEERTYVLCDVFSQTGRTVRLSNGKTVSPGSPILYFRANPASLLHKPPSQTETSLCIYDARDNSPIWDLRRLADATKPFADRRQHPLEGGLMAPEFNYFYEYIRDARLPATKPWPYRPDSYLLISAGMDGLYGTDDDIRNFGR